jgi:hypothetical protein
MSIQMPSAGEKLAALLTIENAKKAICKFLEYFENGDILKLAKDINADARNDAKRQLGQGEALWLWDKDTGEDELRKLLVDYKIVAASNRAWIVKTSSLSACVAEWRETMKSVRIPWSVLVREVSELSALFPILRDIASNGELPYEKRSTYLGLLENKMSAWMDFSAKKTEVFRSVFSAHLTGFSREDADSLYNKLPMESFTLDRSTYENKVASLAAEIRSGQEKEKLRRLWEEKTGTKSPKEWSDRKRTPIMVLVPDVLRSEAGRAFEAINRTNSDESEVRFALEFLQSKAEFLSVINDLEKIDSAFVKDIVGKYRPILPNADDVRKYIETDISPNYYTWYGDPAVTHGMEKFAQAKYSQGGSEKAFSKIEKMDAEKVKEYLKRLIKENMNVGIEIISEGSSEE